MGRYRQGEITFQALKLFRLVEQLDKGKGCWAGKGYFAEHMELSVRQIQRHLVLLVKVGLLVESGHKLFNGRKHRILKTYRYAGCLPVCLPNSSCTTYTQNERGSNGKPFDPRDEKEGESHKVGNTMPFNKEWSDQEKKKGKVSAAAVELAGIHRQWCGQLNWSISTAKNKWGKSFQILLNQHPYERVKTALDWYHKNYPSKLRMKLKSGHEFKQQFEVVETFMERDVESRPIEVSDEAKSVATEVRGLDWKGQKDKLPTLAQLSIDSYTPLVIRFRKFKREQPERIKVGRKTSIRNPNHTIVEKVDRYFRPPSGFVLNWLRRLNEKLTIVRKDGSQWSGDLIRYGKFHTDHWLFKEELSRMLSQTEIDKLMEEIDGRG